ncbi:futalosine hydrolase [Sphingobacterium sp. FBM7-1]|uniref:phosphorylase family protein n=1 Tax=Sphingobacterium sp. FBM7-1 TaxID=2886688 RepID=UPI001D11A0A0|nr:futalosine hydrolase [Sphingobacterium sp. FBM7-1]MCC2599801.1 futalosine hydrolase [Sphingobacterium sp. FBM7-1]
MKILVVAATRAEILPSLPFLEERGIPYLITGIGMVATTYSLTKRLLEDAVDMVVQVGIGGILDRSARLGEVYQISTDEIFGLGADDNGLFIPIEELGFGKRIFKERLPDGIQFPPAERAQGITVNNVHGAVGNIAQLQQQYQNLLIESMEGAAVFFVAEQVQIYCLQFRATSNYIEPRNRDTWEIALAIKNLNTFLKKTVDRLTA